MLVEEKSRATNPYWLSFSYSHSRIYINNHSIEMEEFNFLPLNIAISMFGDIPQSNKLLSSVDFVMVFLLL